MKENLRKVGSDYEKIAGKFLAEKGYQILEYNFRSRTSEIDIIAKQEDVYVFCEVKYRKTQNGSSLEAVNYQKQKQISKAALYYMMRHKLVNVPCRFDVIGIEGNDIIHIENAFHYVGA